MSAMYVCSSCGYVIDERLHPAPDIGAMPSGERLGRPLSCPLCGAEQHMLRPCACAPKPEMRRYEFERKVHRLGKLAEYEAHLCESNRFFQTPLKREAKPFRRLLHEMHACLGSTDLTARDLISEGGYNLLLRYSANYYWFCRILNAALSHAGELPLTEQAIESGISEVLNQLGPDFINTRPLRDFPHWETALGVVRGALMLEPAPGGTYRIALNTIYEHGPRIARVH